MTDNDSTQGDLISLWKEMGTIERIFFILLQTSAIIWWVPFFGMVAGKQWGLTAFIINIIVFLICFLFFKFFSQRRTGEKVSLNFNPSFWWANKKHKL